MTSHELCEKDKVKQFYLLIYFLAASSTRNILCRFCARNC